MQAKVLMSKLLRKSNPSSGPEDRRIIKDMDAMMEKVVIDLSSKYKMFKNCRLLETGSIFEGVKLGVPDEFDFMIDLPSLGEHTKSRVEGAPPQNISHLVNIDLSKSEIFSDLFPKSHRVIVEKCKYCPIIRNAWYRRIFDVIEQSMKTALPTGWHWQPVNEMEKWTLDNGKVYTYNLWWDGPGHYLNLHVSVDIVLSIPLNESPEFISEDGRLLEKPSNGNGRGKFAADSANGNQDLVYGDDSELRVVMSQPGIRQLRVTSSVIESAILNNSTYADAKPVLCMAKLLALRCIGRHLDRKTHRFTSRLPTYWIKTIWLYMIARYPTEAWVGVQNRQDRLLEIFRTILDCLNRKWLSSFFMPGYNVIKMKGMSSIALGLSTTNHITELYQGLHHCIDTILTSRTFPKFVTDDKELTNLRLRTLFFFFGRQKNMWGKDVNDDQELCRQDAGGRDAAMFEAGIRGYIDSYFPNKFELRHEANEWFLYVGIHKVDLTVDYEDVVEGKYLMGKPSDGSPSLSHLRKTFSTVLGPLKKN